MTRLVTEWSTDGSLLGDQLRYIAGLDPMSRERLEMEAALHTWQAQRRHQLIGDLHGTTVMSGARDAEA